MNTQSNRRPPAEDFRDIRQAIDARLNAKGIPPSRFATDVLESAQITPSDVSELKDHMAMLIIAEGRRNFWSGFATNALFFALGIVAAKF